MPVVDKICPAHLWREAEREGVFRGSEHGIMQIPWMMLTNAKVSEDLVYKTAKTIAESKDALKKSFGAFGRAKREAMAPANEVPYHPGALKYYKEAGIKVGN